MKNDIGSLEGYPASRALVASVEGAPARRARMAPAAAAGDENMTLDRRR
jgi:hypothetical protein